MQTFSLGISSSVNASEQNSGLHDRRNPGTILLPVTLKIFRSILFTSTSAILFILQHFNTFFFNIFVVKGTP